MIEFWQRYHDKLLKASLEHIQLVVISVALAFLICIPLYLISRKFP